MIFGRSVPICVARYRWKIPIHGYVYSSTDDATIEGGTPKIDPPVNVQMPFQLHMPKQLICVSSGRQAIMYLYRKLLISIQSAPDQYHLFGKNKPVMQTNPAKILMLRGYSSLEGRAISL